MKPFFSVLHTCIVFLGLSLPAQATLLSYQGTFAITSTNVPGELIVGDTFDFSFSYDDTTIDTTAVSFLGSFNNAVTEFSLTRVSGAGTWDPAGGTFDTPAGSAQTHELIDVVEFENIGGTGFPTLDGNSFDFVKLEFDGPTITDTGLGQTLAAQLGGPLSGNLADFSSVVATIENDDEGRGLGALTSFSRIRAQIPIPSTMLLLASGLVGLMGRRRKARA